MNKFVYRLNPVIAQDVMIEAQPPQTYSKALSRALKVKVFVKKIYG